MVTLNCGAVQFEGIEAVIFDKDGTLEDSRAFLRELSYRRSRLIDAQIPGTGEPLLMAFGVQDDQIDPTGLMAVGSRHENHIAAAAYIAETGRGWFESLAIANQAFDDAAQYVPNTSPLFDGSLDIIQTLFNAGLKIAILSSDSTPGIQHFVERNQLSDYIQLMIGSDQGLHKPDPALFVRTCQTLGVDPKATVMVGDSQGDIQMAQQAGAGGTIGICWGNADASQLKQADVAIANLNQIQLI